MFQQYLLKASSLLFQYIIVYIDILYMYNFPKFTSIVIILISIIVIFSCAYFKSLKEGLTNNNYVILMGDSVLNNENYVPIGKSVYDILKKKINQVLNVSKDGATINDLYGQLDKIPIDVNNSETYIFISVGGNDILNKRSELDSAEVIRLFNTYMEFLKALRTKLGSVNINIMNLYQPANPRYRTYKQSIEEWNKLINQYSNKIGEMYNVVDLNSLLTTPQDFVYDIEPSDTASDKIANLIYLMR
jgi:lysophospholipase L1-like esterase